MTRTGAVMIVAGGVSYEILPQTYIHLAAAAAGVLEHNAKIGEGIVFSANSGPAGTTTLYAALHGDRDKEAVFENVRNAEFPHRPSRIGAFFLFEDSNGVNSGKEWFKAEGRIAVDVRATTSTQLHRADAVWLNCDARDYEEFAHRYWAGQMSEKPVIEIVTAGPCYLPEWQGFKTLLET